MIDRELIQRAEAAVAQATDVTFEKALDLLASDGASRRPDVLSMLKVRVDEYLARLSIEVTRQLTTR